MILRSTHIGPVVWKMNGYMIQLRAASVAGFQHKHHSALWVISSH